MQVTATLKNAFWVNDHRAPNIAGDISDDIEHRFPDNSMVFTSTVLEDLGDGLYKTRNSIYRVEFMENPGAPSEPIKKAVANA